MEQTYPILEISNTELRLVIGGVIDGEPVIVYKAVKPISGLISRGEVLDEQAIVHALEEFRVIKAENFAHPVEIHELTLVIPSIGLEIFETEKSSNVVSPAAIIEHLDVDNVISLIMKEPLEAEKEIIDVVPDYFRFRNTSVSIEPPIGQTSNELGVHAKVHVMLRKYSGTYKRIVENAGLRVRRVLTTPYALSEFVKSKPDLPKDYLLVDMGAQVSSITLVGAQTPFVSTHILAGGNDLTLSIMEQWNCSEEDANTIKERYGLTQMDLKFRPKILSSLSQDGEMKDYYPEDLDHIIEGFFRDNYFKQIDNAIMSMLKDYPEEVLKLPIIFTGGFSKMRGFAQLAKERYSDQTSLHFLNSDTIAVRHPKYLPLVGTLLSVSHYKGSLSDIRPKVHRLERVDE